MSEMNSTESIDTLIANLDQLDELPIEQHPAVFDEIHAGLRDALANAGRDEDPSQSA